MDIHQLKVFASVFKNKSFSRASEELYLTQPTISNHIKGLEEELECKLFDRLGRTIIPTKEAEVLFTYSSEIIEKANNLKEIIGKFQKELKGKVTIGASTIPGTYLLPRIMAGFKEKYPSVFFQILVSDSKGIVESISRHEILLGIVGAKIEGEHLQYIPFVEDELIVVASPSLGRKHRMSLKEIVSLPIIMREEGSGTRKETERLIKQNGISLERINISGVFGSTDAIKQAVKTGLGVSIISKFAVSDELKHKTLVRIPLTGLEMKRTFYLVLHRKRTLPVAYTTFLGYLREETSIS